MNNVTFFIPEKIKVGYQNRGDTYTGKLAYVIYYDNKGVLRKETSWKSWSDPSIPSDEFDNIPTEGFVINKRAGGTKSGWNSRQFYCRLFDPRGFEIEITVDNFLWILENCDIKGKALVGKFVYSWLGTDLILLPECSEEYNRSKLSSDKMFRKGTFKSSELIPGSLYKLKVMDWKLITNGDEEAREQKSTFIGLVKVQKEFGKRYETKALFYSQFKNSGEEVVYFVKPENVEYEDKKNFIDNNTVNRIKSTFEKTAYSYNFWHSNIISRIYTISPTEYEVNNKLPFAIYNHNDNSLDFYRSLISFGTRKISIYHSSYYFKERESNYLFCKFKLNNNRLIIENISTIGEVDKKFRDVSTTSDSSCLIRSKLYPNSTKNDWDNLKILKNENLEIAVYETIDGYFSRSLNELLCYLERPNYNYRSIDYITL